MPETLRAKNVGVVTGQVLTSGPGFLHTVVVGTPIANGTVLIYDALTATNLIATITCPATGVNPFTVILDTNFSTGLTVTTTGTNINVTFSVSQ